MDKQTRQTTLRTTAWLWSKNHNIIINDGRGLYRLTNSLHYTETVSWVIDRQTDKMGAMLR